MVLIHIYRVRFGKQRKEGPANLVADAYLLKQQTYFSNARLVTFFSVLLLSYGNLI